MLKKLKWIAPLALLGLMTVNDAHAGKVKIKMGTLAPEGSAWHNAGMEIAEQWKKVSGGKVKLKIYPGGVAGDEGDMIRKMKIGQLHAAMLTGVGMGRIHRSTYALQLPMMLDSWEQLDYVRGKMAPAIEKEMLDAGFVVVSWGDAGWVHQFSKTPAVTPDDFRKLKYFVWAGDPEAERAFRAANFKAVPLSSTDVMSGLQTGMIEAFGTTPLFALSSQWFGLAKHMVRIKWAPLNGATIVTKKQWDKIDPETKKKLIDVANKVGSKLNAEVRSLDGKAIQAMKDRGLTVVEPDAAVIEQWRKTAEMAWPEIRGKVVPAKYFDAVQKHAAEFKAQKK